MKTFGLLVAFLAVTAYAVPVENNKSKEDDSIASFENYIREALENFRNAMKDGIPAINLPPVEPLHLKDQRVKVNQDHVDLDLKLHEIIVTGLSGFQVLELKPDLPNLSAKAIFRFPRVTISGSYDVNGKILKFIPVFGNGEYNVTIIGAEIGGGTSIILGEETMEVTPPDLHLKWDKVEMDMGNFLGGGSFGDTVQKLIPSLGKTLFEQYKPQILKEASQAMTKEINKQLNTEKIRDIVGKIILGITQGGLHF